MVWLIVVGILLVLVLLWLYAIAPQLSGRPDFAEFRKYDYAHRGLHNREQGVPENSMRAFELAAGCGFGMEFDLQLTKDNRVVVHHDHSIKRTCGADLLVSDLTWEELQQYRLFGTEQKIPLFSEVLKTVDGRTPLIIELKGYNDVDTLCALSVEVLNGYRGLYCVESFDPRIVRWFREHHPEIVRGQLMEHLTKGKDGLTAAQAFSGRNLMTNFLTRPNFEAYDFHYRKNLSLRTAKRLFGMQEVSWTLRNEQDYQTAKREGNLCIFENILPVKTEQCEQKSFEEILAASRSAVCTIQTKTAEPKPKATTE